MFGYTDADITCRTEPHKQVRYCIFGKEICPTTGRPHLQGFLVFHNPKTFSQAKAFFGDRYHTEKLIGTPEQNIAYCSKDEEYYEVGDPPAKGARNDISTIRQMVKEGKTMEDIMEVATSYQSAKMAEMMLKYKRRPKKQKRTIKWYWGATGTGKTYDATEEAGEDYWVSQHNLRWWAGYCGQKVVIIDDFRKDFCTFHELLRLTDVYPYYIEQKNGGMWLQPTTTTIIITSCYPPEEVYNTREDIGQLLRRIDEIRLYKAKGVWYPYTPQPHANGIQKDTPQVSQGLQAQAEELEEVFS